MKSPTAEEALDLWSYERAAKHIGISVDALRHAVMRGKIPTVKQGRRVFFRAADLALFAHQRVHGVEPLPSTVEGSGAHQRRMQAAAMIAAGMKQEAVARELGVNAHTVSCWANEPAVREQVVKLRAENIERVRASLERVGVNAVQTYNDILRQATTPRKAGGQDFRAKGDVLRAAVAAADSVLDRIGVKRETRVEHAGKVVSVIDLVNSLDDELAEPVSGP